MPTERLYGLLPAVHRERDAALGGTLRALLAVLETELVAAEERLGAQYDDWFVETCAPEVLPRIAELVGLDPAALPVDRTRAFVADTVSRHRRRGTTAALAQAAAAATGWQVRIVEYFGLLGMTQHVGHPRVGSGGTVDVRDIAALDRHGGPEASLATRPDVRRIGSGRGRHNVPNVGVFVWCGETFTAGPVEATPVPDQPGVRLVHPLGIDAEVTAVELVDIDGGPAPLVDLDQGRLTFTGAAPTRCRIRYRYRSPGRIGGGPYRRDVAAATRTLTDATSLLTALSTLDGTLTVGGDVVLDRDMMVTAAGTGDVTVTVQAADGSRPTLRGALRIRAGAGVRVVLDGLLIGGPVTLEGAGQLVLRHCTVPAGVTGSHLLLESTVSGPVRQPDGSRLAATDSVLAEGTLDVAELTRVTVLGPVTAGRLTAMESIFAVDPTATETVTLRSCVAPAGLGRTPRFRATRYGAWGYADPAPGERADIGAYAGSRRTHHDAALRAVVDEYLPYGLEAGIIDVP